MKRGNNSRSSFPSPFDAKAVPLAGVGGLLAGTGRVVVITPGATSRLAFNMFVIHNV
jgi:hypothetical protein